ncbi:RING-H2 finger protein ATL60-like [Rutidosis leptorrhynchoides]|uniref:RING-H2 finger protein ATL60-like n=1 Tax=Rutidosis leptorrhynchoides TaxID=125765 RepID=UPI003A98D70A
MSRYHDSQVIEFTGKILIFTIVTLSVIVIFVFLVHIYAKRFWCRREEDLVAPNTHRRHRQRRGDFTAGYIEHQPGVTVLRRGLNPTFLKTIPVIHFDPKDFSEGLECTVCLSELVEGAKARILPKCNHGFHVECIDMWFYSHSTCPICRNPVSDNTQISVENLLETRQLQESSSSSSSLTTDGVVDYFPTNILFWGDESEVSTLTSQLEEANNSHHHHHHHQPSMLTTETPSSSHTDNNRARTDLVIDIPTPIDDVDDKQSPVSSRMGSLRRILSGSRRFINPF